MKGKCLLFSKCCVVCSGLNGGCNPRTDQCNQDDLHHQPVLQHLGANDVTLHQSDQSDDHRSV